MRTTLSIAEDALLLARRLAERERICLGEAISELVRSGAQSCIAESARKQKLRGRFALLPARDEAITIEHVRELIEREGI